MSKRLRTFRRNLRRRATRAELEVKMILKNSKEDFKFQVIIGFYIVDFVLPWRMLIVEVDGSSHKGKKKYDQRRDKFLRDSGFSVLHIYNREASNIKNFIVGRKIYPNWLDLYSIAMNKANSLKDKILIKQLKTTKGYIKTKSRLQYAIDMQRKEREFLIRKRNK